jgi:hypothetical protein
VTILFLELVLAARWSPAYFRSGVPLFRLRLSGHHSAARLEEDLNLSFERTFWSPLTFRQLPDGTVAFRERFSPFPIWLSYYIPLMHGRIRLLSQEKIEIIGRNNWAMPLVGGVVMVRTLHEAGPPLASVWVLFWAAMYVLQAMRFRRVSQVAAEVSEGAA